MASSGRLVSRLLTLCAVLCALEAPAAHGLRTPSSAAAPPQSFVPIRSSPPHPHFQSPAAAAAASGPSSSSHVRLFDANPSQPRVLAAFAALAPAATIAPLPLDANDAIILPPLVFANSSEIFFFSISILQKQRWLLAFASHPLLSLVVFRRDLAGGAAGVTASTTRFNATGDESGAGVGELGAASATFVASMNTALPTCSANSQTCDFVLAAALLDAPAFDPVSVAAAGGANWTWPRAGYGSGALSFPFTANVTGARAYYMPASVAPGSVIPGQLQVGQSDYWALPIGAADLPMRVNSYAYTADGRTRMSCTMDVFALDRPYATYFPAAGAAHPTTALVNQAWTLAETNATNSSSASAAALPALPGFYIVLMKTTPWRPMNYYFLQPIRNYAPNSGGGGSGSGGGSFPPYAPPPSFDPSGTYQTSSYGSTTILVALCSVGFVLCFYVLLAWCRHRAMRELQEQQAAADAAIVAAGGVPPRRRPVGGCTPEQIEALPLCEYSVGLLPPDGVTCAICISDYEPREMLRALPCRHFFHAQVCGGWGSFIFCSSCTGGQLLNNECDGLHSCD